MLLAYFGLPEKSLSLKKLDKITNHKNGMFTWQGVSLLWLASIGFEVINFENIDYKMFAKNGSEYLKKIWPKETFDIQNKYSDLKKEQQIATKLLNNPHIQLKQKSLSIKEIKNYFDKGYFIMVSVNSLFLANKKGYSSHMVVITGFDNTYVHINDPGLPAKKNWEITYSAFEKSILPPIKPDTNTILFRHRRM